MSTSTGRTRTLRAGALAAGVIGLAAMGGAWALAAMGGAWALIPLTSGPPETCRTQTADGYVFVPGGSFEMGSEDYYAEERPVRPVTVDGFWMRATEVTNADFKAFVEATGYVTVAERPPAPGRAAGSAVFVPPQAGDAVRPMSWWHWVPGAGWRAPEGPGSTLDGRMHHPVTHIAYEDALAYARWAGEALPSEEQWEYAANAAGTAADRPYTVDAGTVHYTANTWQGSFPFFNAGEDGFAGTAPVGCFAANAFGLHDMIGNVWEWTTTSAGEGSGAGIIKGGSYLCAPNYCMRYRPSAREAQETGLGTSHIGFRTVRTGPPPADTLRRPDAGH